MSRAPRFRTLPGDSHVENRPSYGRHSRQTSEIFCKPCGEAPGNELAAIGIALAIMRLARDLLSQNVTISWKRLYMRDTDSGQAQGDGGHAEPRPPCVALVPVVSSASWSRVAEQPRSRADFVAHLIATAECAPQTRILQRATAADAQSAYAAGLQARPYAGVRTRQII